MNFNQDIKIGIFIMINSIKWDNNNNDDLGVH